MSVEYYKKELKKEQKKSRYAWGQYFQIREELFEVQTHIYDEINEVREDGEDFNENHNETNSFLMNFIRELYKTAKKSVECPICLEQIESDDLETTGCGHNFHKQCIAIMKDNAKTANEKFMNCALCRKKIWVNS